MHELWILGTVGAGLFVGMCVWAYLKSKREREEQNLLDQLDRLWKQGR